MEEILGRLAASKTTRIHCKTRTGNKTLSDPLQMNRPERMKKRKRGMLWVSATRGGGSSVFIVRRSRRAKGGKKDKKGKGNFDEYQNQQRGKKEKLVIARRAGIKKRQSRPGIEAPLEKE